MTCRTSPSGGRVCPCCATADNHALVHAVRHPSACAFAFHRDHRRGLSFRERQRTRYPRAGQGHRGRKGRGARRHQFRRRGELRPAAEPRFGFILSVDDEELAEGNGDHETIEKLRKFVAEIRRRNADIPIFLYGETRTTHHLPNELLRELHGFIHMFEDTPEFVARYIVREARAYLDTLAPPFFRALVHYAQDGSYSGTARAFRRRGLPEEPRRADVPPVFRRNMLRADVCNSVDELGQLLDHTGPVAASERNAARIFGADHLFFVTNGTSTSNKIVWHYMVAPGDVVLVDRNCHKSVLHAITMTGAIPVFLTPTRNHYGIIGPIPLEEFHWESIQAKI